MNIFFRLTLSSLFVLIANLGFSYTDGITPPDSTTSIVDKASSIYTLEEGKTAYNEGKIKIALVKFRQAFVKDGNSWKAAYWIGKCHYRLNNYGYALKYANQAMDIGGEKVTNEIYFLLGTSYHRKESLDTAIVNYKLALEKLPKTRSNVLRISHLIEECEFAKQELSKESPYTRVKLEGNINSGYDDYGVVLFNNGKSLLFTSRRSNTTGGGMNPDDQRYFEDSYLCQYNESNNTWDKITNELGHLNSDGFDAVNYISPDGLTGILTLNTTAIDIKKTTRGSDLCEIKKNSKGTWNSPRAIKNKSINTSFFEGSATVTSDGNTMYFVTDRKGDKSSTDIYVVERVGKKWGEAKPLPMTINTTARETTPYITPDGRFLFFSSNGYVGLGGLDIYVVENLGDSWGEPINLGAGINTVNNDTHFVYNKELIKAYISSVLLIGNKASIDIYEIDMTNFSLPITQ